MTNNRLPELAQEKRWWQDPYPTFPDSCPSCGADAVARGNSFHPVTYACGAAYTMKPQIQNHRDIWWGSCPA